jgi:hypothetical protein
LAGYCRKFKETRFTRVAEGNEVVPNQEKNPSLKESEVIVGIKLGCFAFGRNHDATLHDSTK